MCIFTSIDVLRGTDCLKYILDSYHILIPISYTLVYTIYASTYHKQIIINMSSLTMIT